MKKRSHVEKLMVPAERNDRESSNGSGDGIRRRIAETAYNLYEQRGQEDGHDLEDWLKAEAIVKSQAEH